MNKTHTLLRWALTFLALAFASLAPAAQTDIPGPAGSGFFGAPVTYLPNGNFVVVDRLFDLSGPTVADVGAVYLYDGTTLALISTLTGSTANDRVGTDGVTVLSNGNFVVTTQNWNGNRGAVTWGSATTGVSGTVSAANSLVGSTANEQVGQSGVTALTNGNYVVGSIGWNGFRGAATWGNGTTGTVGAVSNANSLVGSVAGDVVSSLGVTALTNGHYVVASQKWDNGAVANVGAVTWCNGTASTVATVSTSNSLYGNTAGDGVGSNGVTALPDGAYAVSSTSYDNGAQTNAGAISLGNGATGLIGPVSAANSVLGTLASNGTTMSFSFHAPTGNLLVGQPATNRVSVFNIPFTATGGWVNGANFEISTVGTTNPGNNWPANESPDKAVDGDANTKFLLFQSSNAGIIITPSSPAAYNTIALTTADDAPERDPQTYKIYGSVTALPTSGNIPIASLTLLDDAGGNISLTATRNAGADVGYFKNTTAYASYVVVFPTVKNSPTTTITQIAEVGLSQRATPNVRINEVDSDTPGTTDAAEFVELSGPPNAPLDGLVLVFFNGANDLSYRTYDLDGFSLDANGFFLVGNSAVPGVDLVIPNNTLQNGADAVALYRVPSFSILLFTAPAIGGYLLDAIVYGTDQADDTGLIAGLGVDWGLPVPVQYNENANGLFESQSVSRSVDGGSTIVTQNATPGAPNSATTAPVVTTATQSGVTATSATLGGEVTADGGAAVTDRGIVWNTTGTPTTADTKVANGTGTGVFSATVSGLPPGTTVHVRAYAINSVDTSYGTAISFASPPGVLSTLVTNTLDSGAGSLRQAVLNANANPGADAITFDPTVFATAQTIALTSALPSFTGDATVTGPAAGVNVQASSTAYEVFRANGAANVSFAGLTITNGSTGVNNTGTGTVTVSGCVFSATTDTGISNTAGTLLVNDSTIRSVYSLINSGIATMTGCTVITGLSEAALNNSDGGTLTLINCTALDVNGTYLFNNQGSGSTVTAIHCTLIERAQSDNVGGATLTLKNTIFRTNTANTMFTDGGGNLILNRTADLAADLTTLGLDPTGLKITAGRRRPSSCSAAQPSTAACPPTSPWASPPTSAAAASRAAWARRTSARMNTRAPCNSSPPPPARRKAPAQAPPPLPSPSPAPAQRRTR